MNKASLLACACALALAVPSMAATVVDSDTFNLSIPGSDLLVLDTFDSTLGTLTAVKITLTADTSAGTISWDNENGVSTDITLGVGATVTANAPGALTLTAVPLQSQTFLGVSADNDGTADFSGLDSASVTGGSGSDSDIENVVSPFTGYVTVGPGTFNVTINAILATSVVTSGGFGPTQVSNGITEGSVVVEYTYTPVPEPASLSALAVGAAALLLRRRK